MGIIGIAYTPKNFDFHGYLSILKVCNSVTAGMDLYIDFLACSTGPRGYKEPPAPIEDNGQY